MVCLLMHAQLMIKGRVMLVNKFNLKHAVAGIRSPFVLTLPKLFEMSVHLSCRSLYVFQSPASDSAFPCHSQPVRGCAHSPIVLAVTCSQR